MLEIVWPPPDVEEHTFTSQVTNQAECLTVGVVIKSLVATISRGKRRAALILLGNWDNQFEEIVLMGICTLFLEQSESSNRCSVGPGGKLFLN